ncbi:TatD family hydrolase [Candidatus Haliotispira prima]|uniref:TatD family hydrolase n=1 Tax=Candidatus Haliotispira prima TaxID=3034016 RepID=A0ABY8MG81_9SPIO|nr:TatD family hydrolase [Candidatus Haliotispira prima]
MHMFDTHCHMGLIVEDSVDRYMVAQEALRADITAILSITNNLNDFDDLYQCLSSAKNVYFGAGISPSEVKTPGARWQQRLCDSLRKPKVLALGETGLDYYKKYGSRDSQIGLFTEQLDIAEQSGKPVVIHNRDASQDIFEILRDHFPSKGAVLHCYSDGLAVARKFLGRYDNLYFSFSGNITYRTAKSLNDVVREIPSDRLLVESESPFMVPEQKRGQRNHPANLKYTIEQICKIRDESKEKIREALYQNACRLFGLSL